MEVVEREVAAHLGAELVLLSLFARDNDSLVDARQSNERTEPACITMHVRPQLEPKSERSLANPSNLCLDYLLRMKR